jgi:WhiB family redox-sensing transcriptional regulator
MALSAAVPVTITAAPERAGWRRWAACRGADPDLFFPERGDTVGPAKKVCSTCLVRVDCLEDALALKEKFGIWGGKSERERRLIRRDRNRRRYG